MPRARASLLGLLLVLLTGCATQHAGAPSTESWQQRRTRLQQLDQFAFKARLAAAVRDDGFNASVQWRQQGERSDIDLRAPLGFGTVRVERDAERVRVQTSRGEQLDGEAALASLAARLGFAPPLQSLRYWMLGVPDPGQPSIETPNVEGRYLSTLEQDGWRIEYQEYRDVGGVPMPRRAQLTRAEARLRLIVDEWTL